MNTPSLFSKDGLVEKPQIPKAHSTGFFMHTKLFPSAPVHFLLIYVTSPPEPGTKPVEFLYEGDRNFKLVHGIGGDSLNNGFG